MKQNNMKKKIVIILITILLITFTSSCNKVKKINFDKIRYPMTYEEVIQILGEPNDKITHIKYDAYFWFSDARSIEEAKKNAKNKKYSDYIVVVFSVELASNNKQLVLNKKMESTKLLEETVHELYTN